MNRAEPSTCNAERVYVFCDIRRPHLGSADGSNTQPQQQETLIVRGFCEVCEGDREIERAARRGCEWPCRWPYLSKSQQTFCDEPPVPGPGRPGTPELRLPTIVLGRAGGQGVALLLVHPVGATTTRVWVFLMRLNGCSPPSPHFLTQTGDWICSLGSQGPACARFAHTAAVETVRGQKTR